jgi:hypothetical protein
MSEQGKGETRESKARGKVIHVSPSNEGKGKDAARESKMTCKDDCKSDITISEQG